MAEEPFIPDGAREKLAPLLGLRPLVGSRAPHAAAERFDTGLSLLGTMLDTLRCRSEVDSEAAMERMLPVIAERMDATVKALRDAGEAGAAGTLARTLEAVIAPVKEHLARWRAAPRVHAGPCAVLRIAPDEYLILCMMCLAPAERLRAWPNGVSFSRSTGAVSPPSYSLDRAPVLFARLERDGASALCADLDRERRMIGYCPDCGALYCPAHYETRETWSGSWLEDLHGTCAKGHRRELA